MTDIERVLDLAIALGDLARKVRREREAGKPRPDGVIATWETPTVKTERARDLLHLPHVVIFWEDWREKGGDWDSGWNVTEFASGLPAHEFAMKKMLETPNTEMMVCVRVRTLKALPAIRPIFDDTSPAGAWDA